MTNRAGRLLTRIDRSGDGLTADLFLYALSAAFALLTAHTSTLLPHRAWGAVAFWAYLAATVATAAQFAFRRRPRAALAWVTWLFVCLSPLVVEAVQRSGGRTDRAQDEVLVVERMGDRLLQSGTPYLSREAILGLPAGDRLGGYHPYQPGMAVFGLPRAAFGNHWWTDARVWFAVVTAAALILAVRLLPQTSARVRAVQVATVFPICALTLATGGDDLPVLALCLLALAFAGAGRYGWAGVAAGLAGTMKLFAFPVIAVLIALALRDRAGRRLLPGAVGLPVIVLVPPLLIDAGGLVENVVRFPLGHGVVASPAQSPFPGYLIAEHLPAGRYLATGLLIAVAAAIGVRLWRDPPPTATAAALISGLGLLAAILLMPTTRFGYLLYPAAFLIWAPALRSHTAAGAPRHEAALYRR